MDKQPRDNGSKEAPKAREDEELPENRKEASDRRLDEAVEETFPASDPVSVRITK